MERGIMNIFITGVTGFIGKAFLKKLLVKLEPEDRIFVLTRKEFACSDERVVQLMGDLESISAFKEKILNCEYFFHLAAYSVFGDKFDYDKTNYLPVVQIVDILRENRVLKNFIFLSSIGAVDRSKHDNCSEPLTIDSVPAPTSNYGRSKLKSEEYIRKCGIPYTIIRPTWVYGSEMRNKSHINRFVSIVYENSLFPRFAFPGRVSLIHVDDLAHALVKSIDNNEIINKTYFAETEALSIGNIFRIIYNKIIGKDIRQIKLPDLSFILRKMHNYIPLTMTNLFLDYLCAEDKAFRTDFDIHEFISLEKGIDHVIRTNINNGYWIITGANSGIGLELTRKLDKMGKNLILVDKDTDKLTLYDKHIINKTDLSWFDDIRELTDRITKHRIFCLINNAGIGFKGSFAQLSMDKISETIDVNVSSGVLLTKLLLDKLIKDESVIVNIASSVAYNPLPYMSMYAASKAFLLSWSQSLSYELRETNRVVTLSPSGTYTNFQRAAGVKVRANGKGLLSAGYVADRIIRSVYSGKTSIVLDFKTKMILLLSKLLPGKLNLAFWGRMFSRLR